jgi:hypothetical protein
MWDFKSSDWRYLDWNTCQGTEPTRQNSGVAGLIIIRIFHDSLRWVFFKRIVWIFSHYLGGPDNVKAPYLAIEIRDDAARGR